MLTAEAKKIKFKNGMVILTKGGRHTVSGMNYGSGGFFLTPREGLGAGKEMGLDRWQADDLREQIARGEAEIVEPGR